MPGEKIETGIWKMEKERRRRKAAARTGKKARGE
jgi:hypothetical protein